MADLQTMYPGVAFSPQATLTKAINEADTIIYLSSTAGLPDGPNLLTIGVDEEAETVLYAVKLPDSVSGCTRGVEGAPKVWQAGEPAGRNFTNADFAALINNITALNQNKQEAQEGKGLSANDYTDEEKQTLAQAAKTNENQDKKLEELGQGIGNHLKDGNNPHKVTAQQIGAEPEGSAREVEEKLNTHKGDTNAHLKGAAAAADNTFYGKKGGILGFYKSAAMETKVLTLAAAKWQPYPNKTGAYRQQITQADIVALVQPNRTALDSFADLETQELLELQKVERLWLENQNGTAMALAKGEKPKTDLAIQVRIIN